MRDVKKYYRIPGRVTPEIYAPTQASAAKRPSNGSKGALPGMLGTPSRRRTSREKIAKLEPKFEKSGDSEASVAPGEAGLSSPMHTFRIFP